MNKFKTYISAIGIIATLLLTGCDIKDSERYIELPAIEAKRTVLLMDFTGQRCTNCPAAHEVIEELVKQYGDSALIGISIHAGALATSVSRTNFERNNIGLMIDEGQEMNDAFGIAAWPMGAVDRINAPGAALNADQWAGAVRSALEVAPGVTIEAEAGYNSTDSIITVNSRVLADADRNVALQIWVVENNIIARQITPNGDVPDYSHQNVLRDVAYPVKTGEPVSLVKDIWSDTETHIKLKWTDKERWNIDNLSIVVFAFQGTDILNATRIPIKQ